MAKRLTRKLALSPLQNRIFWALEWAGEETFHQLLIEVTQSALLPGNRLPPNDQAPFELVSAIEGLVRIGFVELAGVELEDGRRALITAASEVQWIMGRQRWVIPSVASSAAKLEIVLTEAAYTVYRAAQD